jgi:nicotinamide-nucleotide amidase
MKASLITIGDEILIGQIVDTNSAYMAKALDNVGVEVVEILTVADNREAIFTALQNQLNKVDLVVMTGGLGPTKDDVTKKVFCDFFSDKLIENEQILHHVTLLLEAFYNKPISDINKLQAQVPSQAHILFNRVGTAPGMLMQRENTIYVSLPGVPFEMKTIFEEELLPLLQKKSNGNYNGHRTIVTYGIGESLLAEHLNEWESNLPKDVHLAYLPGFGKVRLRLSLKGKNKEKIDQTLQNQIDLLPVNARSYVLAEEDIEINEVVAKRLQETEKTISFAESCTGGKLAALFSERPGASAYFKGGVVVYATQAKIDVLKVASQLIEENSVVSEAVAMEMARQARVLFNSDYAIATTGNAGPAKGDSEAEVGTVYIGIATPEKVYAERFVFSSPRERVVNNAVSKGLELMYKEILKNI